MAMLGLGVASVAGAESNREATDNGLDHAGRVLHKGVATCRTANGWSAPAFFAITGGSWGLQIGVEGVDLVMIVQNDNGMKRLIGSRFELGADASAAAGPADPHASADTNWKLDTEILTYSRAKGAFA